MMQQRDSQRAQEMTNNSISIAQEARYFTARSKEIAEATLLDSSAMKAISILTMFFLPGTAIVVSTLTPLTKLETPPSLAKLKTRQS